MIEVSRTSTPGRSRAPWIRRAFLGLILLIALFLGGATLAGTWYLRFVRASDGHVGLLFLEAMHVYSTPSDAPAYTTQLSTRFPFLSMSSFSLGWRDRLKSASFGRRPDLEGTLITLQMEGPTQVYSICGGRLTLIRLETSDGAVSPNIYYAPNITMGPQTPVRTAEEWERAILSDNSSEILGTLVWLGGYHAPPDAKPVPNLHHEDLAQARLAYEVQMRPAVSARIKDLCRSAHLWIREAAEASTTPHTTRLQGP